MALASLVSRSSIRYSSPVFACCTRSSRMVKVNPKPHFVSRRAGSIAVMASCLLAMEALTSDKTAKCFEFRMTVPDQTVEQAESTVRDHAQALVDVKSLIESEYWEEAQRELRRNSAYLKQDLYTIIQSKEGSSRPLLRKLYSNLFNNVAKLDYAARDKDVARVWECYNNITSVLEDILSRI